MRVATSVVAADVVAIGLDERLVLAGLLVQARELAIRAVVAAIDRDDLLERLSRAIELAEPLFPRRGHALVQRHALGVAPATRRAAPRARRGTSRSARSSRRAARGRAARSRSAGRGRAPSGTRRSTGRRRTSRTSQIVPISMPEPDDLLCRRSTSSARRDSTSISGSQCSVRRYSRSSATSAVARGASCDERLLVGVDRAADVLHLALEQLGQLDVEVGLLRRGRLDGGVALQRLDQLAPAAALALQVGHAAERAGVRRVDAQRLLHRVDRVLEMDRCSRVPAADLHPQSAAEPRSSRSSSLTRLVYSSSSSCQRLVAVASRSSSCAVSSCA